MAGGTTKLIHLYEKPPLSFVTFVPFCAKFCAFPPMIGAHLNLRGHPDVNPIVIAELWEIGPTPDGAHIKYCQTADGLGRVVTLNIGQIQFTRDRRPGDKYTRTWVRLRRFDAQRHRLTYTAA